MFKSYSSVVKRQISEEAFCAGGKNIRKLKYIALLVLIIPLSSYSFAETVVISGHPEYPPFTYLSGAVIEGVGTDVLRAVFKDLGIQVESRYVGNWARTLYYLKEGTIDIIAGCYISDERLEFADYTDNYLLTDPMSIFVKKGKEFKFERWDDLIDKTGGNLLGDSQGDKFDEFKKTHLKIELVSNRNLNYRKLDFGRIDYVIDGLYPAKIYLKMAGLEDRIVHLKNPLQTEHIYIAVSKKSRFREYLPDIDKALERMKKDGTIDRLVEKHIESIAKMNAGRIKSSEKQTR